MFEDFPSARSPEAATEFPFLVRIQRRSLYLTAKRCFDVLAVLMFSPVILPVIGILALLVRRDGGNAFYSQLRLGKDGRVFRLWKLRSMVPDAEACLKEHLAQNPAAQQEWDVAQKLKDDPRVTWLGRSLRKYSIDELPQLWNVFVGDMSLVGPRPMFPEQRSIYPGTACFDFRPGLTGLWQVSDRNGCTFAQRANHDNRYAEAVSLGLDLQILLKTVGVVFRGTGY
jgi:lipopolysaccharide/colanic/teichoic acid biosynthesis glycosyltransferase